MGCHVRCAVLLCVLVGGVVGEEKCWHGVRQEWVPQEGGCESCCLDGYCAPESQCSNRHLVLIFVGCGLLCLCCVLLCITLKFGFPICPTVKEKLAPTPLSDAEVPSPSTPPTPPPPEGKHPSLSVGGLDAPLLAC
eukprot:TRINITY_DN7720_c0_g1_i4.p1 TRINITY_DN7720_c0_g1~~TRINITY_DN7720_c0_g1_i4.p1  ORF type:complete len:136 (+),score=11.83 TRINITY_DN7720_c0_g1_i4:90-497(+)